MASKATTWNFSALDRSLWPYFQEAQRKGLTNLGTYNPKSRLPSGGTSDHARYPAMAFDVGGNQQQLAGFFKAMIGAPGVNYVIYRDMIWSRSQGLHKYTSGGHETHVHVSGTGRATAPTRLTPSQLEQVGKGILSGAIKPSDLPPGSTVRGTGGRIPGTSTTLRDVADVAKSPWEAVKWVGGNWDRMLEVVGGFLLLIIGLILLARSMGVGGRRVGGDLMNRLEYGPTVVRATPEPRVVRVHEVTDEGERAVRRRQRPTSSGPSEEIPF